MLAMPGELIRDERGRVVSGALNPGGRPKDTKGFSRKFIEDFRQDWATYGPSVLERVRRENPSACLAVVSKLVPREVLLDVNGVSETIGKCWTTVLREFNRESQAERAVKRAALMIEWSVYCATVQTDAAVKPIRDAVN